MATSAFSDQRAIRRILEASAQGRGLRRRRSRGTSPTLPRERALEFGLVPEPAIDQPWGREYEFRDPEGSVFAFIE